MIPRSQSRSQFVAYQSFPHIEPPWLLVKLNISPEEAGPEPRADACPFTGYYLGRPCFKDHPKEPLFLALPTVRSQYEEARVAFFSKAVFPKSAVEEASPPVEGNARRLMQSYDGDDPDDGDFLETSMDARAAKWRRQ